MFAAFGQNYSYLKLETFHSRDSLFTVIFVFDMVLQVFVEHHYESSSEVERDAHRLC